MEEEETAYKDDIEEHDEAKNSKDSELLSKIFAIFVLIHLHRMKALTYRICTIRKQTID